MAFYDHAVFSSSFPRVFVDDVFSAYPKTSPISLDTDRIDVVKLYCQSDTSVILTGISVPENHSELILE